MSPQFLKLALLLTIGVVVDKSFADEPERIVGGSDAVLGELPYQVSLRRANSGDHFCGGTLITRGHVVTAAHCVQGAIPGGLEVATGTISNRTGELHKVKLIRVHPEYIADTKMSMRNDIAVITLADEVKENQYQKAIPIASFDLPVGTPLIVSGWGLLALKGSISKTLQKATVFLQSYETCRYYVPEEYPLYDTHLCALNSEGIGVCSGDSGGPLVYNNQLVGVVSWAFPCALGMPDIYMKASKYYEFINESILLS